MRDSIRAEYQKETRETRRAAYTSLHSAAKVLAEIAEGERIWDSVDGLRDAWLQEERLEKAWDEIGFLGPDYVIAEAENLCHFASDTLRGLREVARIHREPVGRRSAEMEEQHVNVLSSQLLLASQMLMECVEKFREQASKALGDVGLG